VISGHFAAAFIGSAGFDIQLSDLSRYSCRSDCQDFFSSVREVYLFGCNTLAGHARDSRTIEQYREILIQDGVTSHEAQRIAARRYTPYGRSIRDEVLSLFPEATRVFGYPSTGPTGSHVRPALESYIKNAYAGSETAKISAFARTLGKSGMIELPARKKDPGQCEAGGSVLVDPKLRTKSGGVNYIKKYGRALPIPSIDLVDEMEAAGTLSAEEALPLRKAVLQQLESLPEDSRRHLLCPLLFMGHRDLISDPSSCLAIPEWMCSLADNPAQCAARF
jgi:hypothetical protein